MIPKTWTKPRLLCSALALAATTLPALADVVELRSADGTVDLSGEFVAFEDNVYVIRTVLGTIRISAERVRCAGAACPTFESAAADVALKGSETVGVGIMPLLVEGYAGLTDAEATIAATGTRNEILASFTADGGYGDDMGKVLVTPTTSADAFTGLLDNSAQIGMSSRRITPDEARALRDAGAGNMVDPDNERIVAIDSLVVITHPDNPVSTLSMDQLAGIYAGRIRDWSELGGTPGPINVIQLPDDSGTHGVFAEVVFQGGAGAGAGGTVAQDNNEAARLVNADPNAIAYVGYAFQRGAKPVTLVNQCGLTMTPDAFSARTEEYPLQRRLYLYKRADLDNERARAFMDYATSDDADMLIRKAGFIDLGVDARAQDADSPRAIQLAAAEVDPYERGLMNEMAAMMGQYERLSTTVRFRTGASKLDERGLVDLKRLSGFLETVPEGARVTFVGFTDDVGAFDANRDLSLDRASVALSEFRAIAGPAADRFELTATGFGEVAPSGCNDTDRGRAVNRRVEVWLQLPN